jgi:nitrite reductase/ring-hydroxylating ferredoxin subunit
MSAANFRRVIAVTEVPEGKMRGVEIDGKSLVICHVKDGWHALDDTCTHAFAKMHEGRLRGVRLICPLHGASFDCRTGAVLGAPAVQSLKTYPARCVDDFVEVELGDKPAG